MVLFLFLSQTLYSQISPGDLTKAHAELEGMSNCTQCHDLGKQVSKAKCLNCHTEIADLMNQNRGFHSNSEVVSKDCWSCHGEHFGRTFQMVRFDQDKFNHIKTGFEIKSSHQKLECKQCHKSEFILEPKLQLKQKTFLGLNTECKNCHDDVHQETLGSNCANCHNEDKFKPASKFSHENTKFILTGKHNRVDCIKCHILETKTKKVFQKFANVKFNNCTDCHKDVHAGKFGDNCKSCHDTNSFKEVNIANGFNHSKTNFPLIGKHKIVKCENCHKGSLTNRLKYKNCTNCHEDFHKGEFQKNNRQVDCKECHNENGFSPSTFTIEQHRISNFELANAHAATPCTACHRKEINWTFRIENDKCISCHENIHKKEINEKYFDENRCESCHTTTLWKHVNFDHAKTDFELLGKHKTTICSDCHIKYDGSKIINQKFAELNQNCTQCHNDIHFGQFIEDAKELCLNCHTNDNWNPTLFDHSKTKFILDGAHNKLDCTKCHKILKKGEQQYINYKIEDVTCKSCHS